MIKKFRSANICINLVPSLSHLELIRYDSSKGSFLTLDSEEVMFDPATRDLLEGEDRIKSSIRRLYERNRIPLKTPTTLILPSFFTRQYSIPEDILNEDLVTILISEAERFYVFKKIDPVVGYCSIKDGQVLYTAYPQQSLDQLKRIFNEVKIPLVSIDSNYTSALRGLVAMDVVDIEVINTLKWGMMTISDFNVFMAVIEGNTIEKTFEAPLSLQNIEEEALLNEIREDFQQFYGFEVLSRIVVINNSFKIYSPTLIENLGFEGPTDVFDQNERTLTSLGAKDGPFPCSLEAIGGALVRVIPEIPSLELSDTGVFEAIVDDTRKNFIALSLVGIAALIFVLQFSIGLLFQKLADNETKKGNQLQKDINDSLNSLSVVPEVKQKLYIRGGINQNYKVSNLILRLHQALPPDAWLEQVSIKGDVNLKALSVNITGGTLSSDPLNTYVKELNTELEANPLTPSIKPQQTQSERYFEFTLTNPTQENASQH